jgi:probable HAF family extracellular repeat protein
MVARTAIWGCAFLAVSLSGSSALAQCASYAVDVIPGPNCQFENSDASAFGLNAAGEVVGAYYTCDKAGESAVWLRGKLWIPLTFPSDIAGLSPKDINSSRQIVGKAATARNPTEDIAGFYDFESKTIELGLLPGGNFSEALAVNDDGTACGVWGNNATGEPSSHGFIWQDGRMSDLALPIGPSHAATGISDSGKVCGWMGTGPHIDGHAFIHDLTTGETVDAGVLLPGAIGSQARAVNVVGAICGWSSIPCGEFCVGRRSFIWQDGIVQDLGVLPEFTSTFALALNDSNTVVGYCDQVPVSNLTRAFVWQNGVVTALNDLIPPELGLDILLVRAINNAGQIVGDALLMDGSGDRVAVRLTPIPKTPGDFTCDGLVNINDLLALFNYWGMAVVPPHPADMNADGAVGLPDLLIVIDNWTL